MQNIIETLSSTLNDLLTRKRENSVVARDTFCEVYFMSKMIFAGALSFCALSVMGLSSFYDQSVSHNSAIDPMITSGVPQIVGGASTGDVIRDASLAPSADTEMFILTGEQSDELCIFERMPLDGGTSARVNIDSDCAPLHPDLTSAVHWKERTDGLIDLIDKSGSPVLTFTNTDGASYETFDSGSVHLTFSPI